MKDKTSAALLAFFLGWSGAHKFYLGRTGPGVIYLVLTLSFFLAWIPALLGFIDFIVLALMDKDEFNRRYNGSNMLGPTPVVLHMLPPAGGYGYGQPPPPGYGGYPPPPGYGGYPPTPPAPMPGARPSRDVDQLKAELEKLNELRIAGLLTEEEFTQQKARLLGG